jgi:hypothetical protein
MIAMHYLVSSSFFVVDLVVWSFDNNGNLVVVNSDIGFNGNLGWPLNYSPLAIFCALIVSLLPLGLLIALSFRKLYPGIPVAGSCSALISAACTILRRKKAMQGCRRCNGVWLKA